MKGKVFAVCAALVAVGMVGAVGDARAICGDGRNMTSFSGEFGTTYLYFAADANLDPNTAAVGRWWDVGNFAVRGGEGTNCGDEQWLLAGPGTSLAVFCYIGGSAGFGFCDNTGACPVDPGDVHVLIQAPTTNGAQFGLYRVAFTPASVHAYDLSKDSLSHNAADIPKPNVLSSSRVGNLVNLTVQLDEVNSAFEGDDDGFAVQNSITGYRLMEFLGAGPADPGRNPASWTLKSSHTYTGVDQSIPTSVDCTDLAQDRFLALQLVFDTGGGEVLSDFVGQSVRVECDPTLATPGKFRLIDRRQPRARTGVSRRNE